MAIRLLKDGDQVPEVPQEALDICPSRQEVTIVDPALRDSMKDEEQSFGSHKVEWKAIEDNSGDD